MRKRIREIQRIRTNMIRVAVVVLPFYLVLRFDFGLLLVCMGVFLNFLAVSLNKWKMPVVVERYKNHPDLDKREVYREKAFHKHLLTKRTVKLYYLTDIFHINFKKYFYFFSIGDVLIWCGILINIIRLISIL